MSQELIDAITDMREDDALRITDELLAAGTDPLAILDACRTAMTLIGQRFEEGDCFVPELILAGEMLKAITAQVKPVMAEEATGETLGKIVFGTVEEIQRDQERLQCSISRVGRSDFLAER